jgi:hypothetical protein
MRGLDAPLDEDRRRMTDARQYDHLGWITIVLHFLAMVVVLAVVLREAPAPYPHDGVRMQRVGREMLIAGCSDLNCFRILVPAIVESFSGPLLERWRWYAVIANAAGAIVTGELALAFGLTRQAALLTMWLSAVGFGSMATVYHPFTADSMMFLLCPIVTLLLVRGRLIWAGAIATIGIFGKEVAAAPLFIGALAEWIGRRWRAAAQMFTVGVVVTAIWIALQLTLMSWLLYDYAKNPSSRLLEGGYLLFWLRHVGAVNAVVAIFVEYGAVYLLAFYGLVLAPPRLRAFAIAAILPGLALSYVQIPDRALWNFYFVWIPLAAIVLAEAPTALAWTFVALFGMTNLRVGAQLPGVPTMGVPMAITIVIAGVVIFMRWRSEQARDVMPTAVHS